MTHEEEQRELEYILSSGVVSPDSNPGRLLRYVCEKYFQGAAAELKERNIALDVFHRLGSFDKRSDSIVRVEAYRLRRRLAEFYAGPGRDRPYRMVIPVGQYLPVLESNGLPQIDPAPEVMPPLELVETKDLSEPDGPAEQPAVAASQARRWDRRRWRWVAAVAAAFLATGLAIVWGIRSRPTTHAGAAGPVASASSEVTPGAGWGDGLRILAGYTRDRHVDRRGRLWLGDRYYQGGGSFDADPEVVARAYDPVLFQTRRDGEDFTYNIPLKQGKYELKLYFNEFHFGTKLTPGGEVSRLMDIYLNGRLVLHNFDVYSEAGGSQVGHIRAFRDVSPASDGKVHIRFAALYDRAFVNGIELLPQPPSGIRPIRMVARPSPFEDKEGAIWEPDDYAVGGRTLVRNQRVAGAVNPELYDAERYGHFDYAIPLPPGKYRVRLYFAEAWFTGPGGRIFNLFSDGRTLLRDFDVLREAGGQHRQVIRTFHNMEPNAQGVLNLSFVPVENYALVNAIEVVSE